VERLVSNRGKHSVTIPNIAAGEYLLRPEIIALHEGNRVGGTQFYMECVQIKVTSSGGTTLPSGVSIPGAYSASDPGILFNLYSGFTSYTIPGPALWNGASGGGSQPSTTSSTTRPGTTFSTITTTRPSTTTTRPVTTTSSTPPTSTGAAQWAQCGGIGFSGPATCQGNFVCTELNPYYSQCL
jgi:lytic cellulose monooxygenase (C1-hydroxylating)